MKADQYIPHAEKEEMNIFVARVCFGNPFMTKEAQINQRLPPPNHHSIVCLAGPDSALHKFSEFMIYDRLQAYPEFLIKLRRIGEQPYVPPPLKAKNNEPTKFQHWIRKYFQDEYSHIGLFLAAEKSEDRPFLELFTPLTMTKYQKDKAQEIVGRYEVESIPQLFGQDFTQVVLEGCAGSGKSTICKYFAREQEKFTKYFDVIFTIELVPLREVVAELQLKEVTIENLLVDYFGYSEKAAWDVAQQLDNGKKRVLWIFDGFDEVTMVGTQHKHRPFDRFLEKLVNEDVDWVLNCIISSRPERKVPLNKYVHLQVEEWKEPELFEYIKKYFRRWYI